MEKKIFDENMTKYYEKEYNIQFIESPNLKYRIQNPREFENPIKKLVLAHLFLYRIFKLPQVLNLIFQIGRVINSIYMIIRVLLVGSTRPKYLYEILTGLTQG